MSVGAVGGLPSSIILIEISIHAVASYDQFFLLGPSVLKTQAAEPKRRLMVAELGGSGHTRAADVAGGRAAGPHRGAVLLRRLQEGGPFRQPGLDAHAQLGATDISIPSVPHQTACWQRAHMTAAVVYILTWFPACDRASNFVHKRYRCSTPYVLEEAARHSWYAHTHAMALERCRSRA